MPLPSGARLGPYAIVAPIGAGGMGEVYQALDTRLGRTVAVKVLPAHLTAAPEARQRFEREARTIAQLSHPNICVVHDVGEDRGTSYLVMEHLQGETLAARLNGTSLPLPLALRIGGEIADALDKAHRAGIVHRDLKPANVMLTKAGVKLLDFGLAKAIAPMVGSGADTLAVRPELTEAGVVLGTPQYMAPEQVEGRAADGRTDVFAFGTVLFEMVTGRKAFEGATTAGLLSAILRDTPPPASNVHASVPLALDRLIAACLAKDPNDRWQSAHDVMLQLRWIGESPETPAIVPSVVPKQSLWWRRPALPALLVGSAVAGSIIGANLWSLRAPAAPPVQVTRFAFSLGEGELFTGNSLKQIAISPDGTHVVYVANSRLYLRSMSELTDKFVTGTDLEGGLWNPAFSPDGQSIVFGAPKDNTIKRIPVGGGVPVTLCEGAYFSGISWGGDAIVFARTGGADAALDRIYRVSPDGGKPEMLVELKKGERGHAPQMLPGDETLLFTLETLRPQPRNAVADSEDAQIVAQSLKSGERKVLIEGDADGRFLRSGHLVFARSGVLFAVPFDPRRLEVTGKLTPVVEGVRRSGVAAQFSVSDTGSLVYRPGPAVRSSVRLDLALIDRAGVVAPLKLPPASYVAARVSPDGKRIAIGSNDDREAVVSVLELTRTTPIRRLTFGGNNRFPVWSPDGQRVAFQSDRDGDLAVFWQRADGSGAAERLTTPEQKGDSHVPETWSPRGDTLLFRVTRDGDASLQALSMANRKIAAFGGIQSPVPTDATVSPDGRWISYAARLEGDSQRGAVYVQPFPATGAKYQIARDGRHPVWSRDGRQLLFAIPGANKYAVVSVTSEGAFTFTTSEPATRVFLDTLNDPVRSFDLAPDGRFVGVIDPSQLGAAAAPQLNVVLNWFEELGTRVKAQ